MGNYSMVRTRPDNSLLPKSPILSRKTSVFAEPASEDEINIQRPRMGKTYEGGARPPRRFILGICDDGKYFHLEKLEELEHIFFSDK